MRAEAVEDVPQRPARAMLLTSYVSFIMIGWSGTVIPSMITAIEHDFHQSDAGFGLLYFLRSLLFSVAALAGGFLTERIGRRAVLASGAGLLVLGYAASAAANTWALFILLGMSISWGSAVIDAGMNALILDLVEDERGGAMNLLHLFFGVGALLAPLPIGLLLSQHVSWRVMLVATAVGFALLLPPLLRYPMPSGKYHGPPASPADEPLVGSERSLVPFLALAAAIACYTAGEMGIGNWVVKLLANHPVTVGTAALSIFWTGLSGGRLLSRLVVERIDYWTFTVGCTVLSGVALAGAVLVPWLPAQLVLYGITGLFSGPVYPMIMVLAGEIYPHRLAALAGGLTTAASLGVLTYPPLMGVLSGSIGLNVAMLGVSGVSMLAAVALVAARVIAHRDQTVA